MEWIEKALATAHKIETVIPWMGYLLVSMIGGIAAYLKEWEQKDPDLTPKQRLGKLGRKLFFAIFTGMIWYQIIVWQNLAGSPFSYIGASLVGLYATEFLDFLWVQLRSRLTGFFGSPPTGGGKS